MEKVTFKDLQIDEEFLYLGMLWKKVRENEAVNLAVGEGWTLFHMDTIITRKG